MKTEKEIKKGLAFVIEHYSELIITQGNHRKKCVYCKNKRLEQLESRINALKWVLED